MGVGVVLHVFSDFLAGIHLYASILTNSSGGWIRGVYLYKFPQLLIERYEYSSMISKTSNQRGVWLLGMIPPPHTPIVGNLKNIYPWDGWKNKCRTRPPALQLQGAIYLHPKTGLACSPIAVVETWLFCLRAKK